MKSSVRLQTPVQDWPAVDQVAWERALGPADPFDLTIGQARRWKPRVLAGIEASYGRWLGWLAGSGQLALNEPPGQRVTRERVAAFRDALFAAGNAESTVGNRLKTLSCALKAISPDGDWQWIHRAGARISSNATLVRDPARRMQPAGEVLALGHDLIRRAEVEEGLTAKERAIMFRDGLMIAFLIQRPLRVSNLEALMLERHLEKRGRRWQLIIDHGETKSDRTMAFSWPDDLAEALEHYLAVHRPRLLHRERAVSASTSALWISARGDALARGSAAQRIGMRSGACFGRPINPHTFRHIAATTIASVRPDCVTDIQAVLSHRSSEIAEKNYNHAQTIGANARYTQTVRRLRQGGGPTRQRHG
jgi:integrase/recombinase XerD